MTDLPHNVEAEQQILGALLTNNAVMGKLSGFLSGEHFFDPVHAAIYAEIGERIDAGKVATPVALKNAFEDHSGLKELGGPAYLAKLAGASIASFAVRDYAEIVVDTAIKRELLAVMDKSKSVITEGRAPAATIATTMESEIGALVTVSSSKPLIRSHLSCINDAIATMGAAYRGEEVPGFMMDIPQVDSILRRFREGRLIVLAGRPGMAKTSIAQNIAMAAMRQNRGVFYGSLEMPGEEMANRFLAAGLAARGIRIPYERIQDGKVKEAEVRHIVDEAKRQESWPLVLAEREVRDGIKLRSAVRRAQQRMDGSAFPLGLVVVDYMQLLQFPKANSFYERASLASDLCKSIAMEFSVPVVACAQLNRDVDRRENPWPTLADMRDSGKLEEDADVVILLYRKAYYLKTALEACDQNDVERMADLNAELAATHDQVDLIIAKHRGGRTGTAKAFMDLACCRLTADRAETDGSLI